MCLDPESLRLLLGDLLLLASIQKARAGVSTDARERRVLGHAHDEYEAVLLTILRHEVDAALDRVPRAERQIRRSVQGHLAAERWTNAEYRLHQLGPTRSDEPGKAQDLSAARLKRDAVSRPRHE